MDIVRILAFDKITHDVIQIITEKPEGIKYSPGQAVEISINKTGWESEFRPFTFTSLSGNDYLEFTIKTYPLHNGVTNKLLTLHQGDELFLHDVVGFIAYKGEGIFIAEGAGITSFIAIFRDLNLKKQLGHSILICANKTKSDIILEK